MVEPDYTTRRIFRSFIYFCQTELLPENKRNYITKTNFFYATNEFLYLYIFVFTDFISDNLFAKISLSLIPFKTSLSLNVLLLNTKKTQRKRKERKSLEKARERKQKTRDENNSYRS